MELKEYLHILARHDGSDLYLTVGAPPAAKFQGQLKALSKKPLEAESIEKIAYKLMNAEQREQFNQRPEMNLAIQEDGIGRFRVNIFKQRYNLAMVIRYIRTDIPDPDKLGLPKQLKELIMSKRGLILFVGGTGTGKSTSLAALLDYRNQNASDHIITIEDPIEYTYTHKKSIVNQREVGVDTDSYEDALKNTLRQAPDVILIGEIRAHDTMEHAISFAETGHLCVSTLHANNANQALDRIINFFPQDRREQLLMDLSLNLRAIISQRLIPTTDGGRTAAFEILLGTPLARDFIRKGEIVALKELMDKSEESGMQTFDGHLFKLYQDKVITLEDAIRNADSPHNLKVRLNLANTTAGDTLMEEEEKPANTNLPKVDSSQLSLEPIQDPDEEEFAPFPKM